MAGLDRRYEETEAGILRAQQPEITAKRLAKLLQLFNEIKATIGTLSSELGAADDGALLVFDAERSVFIATAVLPSNYLIQGLLTVNGNVAIGGALDHNGSTAGVFGTAPATQQTVNGAKGGNAALGSLLTALATYGWIIDNTTP
jgi:hypothetical protein